MNVLRIAFKEFKQNIRDWRANALMVLLPILLMSVLGAALSGLFSSSIDIKAKATYSTRGEGPLPAAFEAFTASVLPMGVRFTRVEESADALGGVRDASIACHLAVSDAGITMYKNDRFAFEADFVQSLLTVFLERYNAAAAVAAVDPALLPRFFAEPDASAVETVSLRGNRNPSALDYYAVTMLTFMILFASVFGMSALKREMRLRTANRMLCAPVRKWEYLTGKLAGGYAVTLVQIAAALAFSRWVLGAYWGGDMATVALILAAEALMATGIGMGAGFLFKNEGAANGIINTLNPVLATFGGSYVPFSVTGELFANISKFDPLAYINKALFGVVYNADYSGVPAAVCLCVGVAIAFIALAALLSRKETA